MRSSCLRGQGWRNHLRTRVCRNLEAGSADRRASPGCRSCCPKSSTLQSSPAVDPETISFALPPEKFEVAHASGNSGSPLTPSGLHQEDFCTRDRHRESASLLLEQSQESCRLPTFPPRVC